LKQDFAKCQHLEERKTLHSRQRRRKKMKRKLALLLAAAMTLSMLPMNMFASSSNYLTKNITGTGNKTVFVESGVWSNGPTNNLDGKTIEIAGNNDIEFVTQGGYLEIEPKSNIPANSVIKVQLENAKWFFRDDVNKNKWSGNVTKSALQWAIGGVLAPGDPGTALGSIPADAAFKLKRTYADATTTSEYDGSTYYRYADYVYTPLASPPVDTNSTLVGYTDAHKNGANVILYTLKVSVDDSVATIEFPNGVNYKAGTIEAAGGDMASTDRFRIPIVARTTSDDDVKILITDTNNSGISTGTWVIGASSTGTTRTYVEDPKTARDEFPINMLIIKENRVASMGSGTIEISAPSGFYFNRSMMPDQLRAYAENFDYGTMSSQAYDGPIPSTTDGVDVQIGFKQLNNKEIDYSVIQVRFNTLTQYKSSRIPGTIYLMDKDLNEKDHSNTFKVYAEDNAAYGDINLRIKNLSSSDIVTDQTFVGGTRKDWSIEFKTIKTVPTLVNGRYEDVDAANANDDDHLAARISFKELIPSAWWLGRETRFELPEGVKFRKVEITKTDKLNANDKSELEKEPYMNTGKRVGKVTLDGEVLKLNNLSMGNVADKALLEMDLWLSIESGFEGDITLTATGPGVPDDLDPIVIAKAISPVQIKTTVSDVKIGYQYYPVADIELIENEAGMLQKGKQVWLSITDNISTDMYFTDGFKHEVTDGNLKIKNVKTSGGTIRFDIDGESSTASTVKFSNLQLKIDRTVPETQVPYNVLAWGPNIAPNSDDFDYTSLDSDPVTKAYKDNDQHTKRGIEAPYVRVVTSASGASGVLSSVVNITAGSTTAYVNGEQVTIDPAPFIDNSGRTQVPVRMISKILGVSEDDIIWSDTDRTVTIDIKGSTRTVQFSIGSDIYLLNGAQVRMDTSAQIVNGRTFVPFRAMGEALGVRVGWDDATRTATYNAAE